MFEFGVYSACVRKKCVLVFSSWRRYSSVPILIEPKEDITDRTVDCAA